MNRYQKLHIQTQDFLNIDKPLNLPIPNHKAPNKNKFPIYNQNTPKDKVQTGSFKELKLFRHNSEEELKSNVKNRVNTPVLRNWIEGEHSKVTDFGNSPKHPQEQKIPKFLPEKIKKHKYFPSNNCSPKNKQFELKSTSSTIGKNNTPTSIPTFFRERSPPKFRSSPILTHQLSINSFQKIKKLGQGKFGKVYLAKQIRSGLLVALKVMDKRQIINGNLLGQFMRQLKIQLHLNHPNIIKVYGYFHTEQNFYTIMQLGCDGQLYSLIEQKEPITQEGASFIAKNLLQATCYLHSKKIIHRDIKPQNIVLVHGNVKLCDFGWAVNIKDDLRSTFCGTPLYLSPEILSGEMYDQKVDIWAIGILIYQLLLGISPFNILQSSDLFNIIENQVTYPKNTKVTTHFRQFITRILQKNPKKRINSQQLLQMTFIRKYEEFETCEQFCK